MAAGGMVEAAGGMVEAWLLDEQACCRVLMNHLLTFKVS